MMTDKINEIASKFLGQKVGTQESYDSNLIVPIPRVLNRERYDISDKDLPFYGFDIWHAYEFSALTNNGVPFTRLLKIKIPCESEYMVESKSLKLYLNSFNMTKFKDTIDDSLKTCKDLIVKDLAEKLNTRIEANFIDNNAKLCKIFDRYENIADFTDEKNLVITNFKEAPELLETVCGDIVKENFLTFDSLRSNCRVTHQPDFGDVFIYYKSKRCITKTGLIKYLTSFRNEYHFHEECCEMIFKRISDILDKDDNLFVCALYTRRGGIDICPVRWSKNFTPQELSDLLDTTQYARYGVKQ